MKRQFNSRQDARSAVQRQLEHLERHPKDRQAEQRYLALAEGWLRLPGNELRYRHLGDGEAGRRAAWIKRQRAHWQIYQPLDPMMSRPQETYPDPEDHWLYNLQRDRIASHDATFRRFFKNFDDYALARNLFPRARYAEGVTWSRVRQEYVDLTDVVALSIIGQTSDEPVVGFEDARAIFNRLKAAVGRIGYKLEMFSTVGGNPPQGRPDGLWAIPKNEPTLGYVTYGNIDFSRCVHLTSDPNGIEKAILACQSLPILMPSGYRRISIEEPQHPALQIALLDQTEFLRRQLRIARERAARKAVSTT